MRDTTLVLVGAKNLRIDKNVAYRVTEFNRYKDEGVRNLIKDLIVYFSYSYQTPDLFGYCILDPRDFCKVMSLDYGNLFRRHPNPRHVEDSPQSKDELYSLQEEYGRFSEYRVFDSYIDNALYILSTEPVINKYMGMDEKGRKVAGLSNFIIIKELTVKAVKVKKTTKLLYTYKLDEMFERNLRRFFLNTSLKDYVALRSKNLDAIYITLCNIIQSKSAKGEGSHTIKFSEALKLLDMTQNNSEPKYLKRNMTKKMRILMPRVAEKHSGARYEWIKDKGSRYAYTILISWDIPKSSTAKIERKQVLDSVFYGHVRRNLLDIFNTQYNIDDIEYYDNEKMENQFLRWLVKDVDMEIKLSTYKAAYVLRFPVPKGMDLGVIAKSFFRSLMECKSKEDVSAVMNTGSVHRLK